MPLPMIVLHTMSVGLPTDSLAKVYAFVMASMSWPSTVSTSQPCASKRIWTSSDCVCSAILSSVTPFESYMTMRLSSFSWPAKATASLATPSWRQPSPQRTTTWWSMMVCSAVLHVAAASFAAAALAERAGRRLDTGRPAKLGVAGRLRVLDAEVLDLLERELVARHVEPRVEEHRAVARREDEAVAVDPRRVGRVVRHLLAEEDGANLGAAERQAHVAGGGLGDRIDREATRLVGRLGERNRRRDLGLSDLHRGRGRARDRRAGRHHAGLEGVGADEKSHSSSGVDHGCGSW